MWRWCRSDGHPHLKDFRWNGRSQFCTNKPKKKTDHDHESSSRDRARERAESTELRAAPRSKLHTSRPNEQPCAPSIAFASRLAWSPRSGACRTPQQQHDRRRRTPNDDDDEEGNGAHTKKNYFFLQLLLLGWTWTQHEEVFGCTHTNTYSDDCFGWLEQWGRC